MGYGKLHYLFDYYVIKIRQLIKKLYLGRIVFIVSTMIFILTYFLNDFEKMLPFLNLSKLLEPRITMMLYSSTLILISMIMIIIRR
ncbi:MAG: hypothetical protein ACXQTP_03805 [Candidatus Methanofastidiosia archaeon]